MNVQDTKRIAREARILSYQTNILATYRRATPEIISEGVTWYPRVKAQIDAILTRYKLRSDKYAFQAFSALSPRISFNENMDGFEKFARAASQYSRIPPVVAGVESNRRKAWQYLTGESNVWIDPKSAPKTARFALNLVGDLSHVTVDVWAARAAGFSKANIRGNDYAELEEAYRRVAKVAGFEPAELQAITWIVARGKGE